MMDMVYSIKNPHRMMGMLSIDVRYKSHKRYCQVEADSEGLHDQILLSKKVSIQKIGPILKLYIIVVIVLI